MGKTYKKERKNKFDKQKLNNLKRKQKEEDEDYEEEETDLRSLQEKDRTGKDL